MFYGTCDIICDSCWNTDPAVTFEKPSQVHAGGFGFGFGQDLVWPGSVVLGSPGAFPICVCLTHKGGAPPSRERGRPPQQSRILRVLGSTIKTGGRRHTVLSGAGKGLGVPAGMDLRCRIPFINNPNSCNARPQAHPPVPV